MYIEYHDDIHKKIVVQSTVRYIKSLQDSVILH